MNNKSLFVDCWAICMSDHPTQNFKYESPIHFYSPPGARVTAFKYDTLSQEIYDNIVSVELRMWLDRVTRGDATFHFGAGFINPDDWDCSTITWNNFPSESNHGWWSWYINGTDTDKLFKKYIAVDTFKSWCKNRKVGIYAYFTDPGYDAVFVTSFYFEIKWKEPTILFCNRECERECKR